jgi:hypothetical protein
MVGGGPVTYDAAVPADTTNITFAIVGGTATWTTQLHVEVSGCGAYDTGSLGLQGSFGGGGYGPERVCAEPTVGPAKVTVSGTVDVLTGTFELYGEQPLPPGQRA